MTRRTRSTVFSRSIQRSLKALTRSAIRAGTKAMTQALKPAKPVARKAAPRKRVAAKTTAARPKKIAAVKSGTGLTVGVVIDRKGALLVADDVGNTIWRVHAPPALSSVR